MEKQNLESAIKLMENKLDTNSQAYKQMKQLLATSDKWAEDLELNGELTEILLASSVLLTLVTNKTFNSLTEIETYLTNNRWDVRVVHLVTYNKVSLALLDEDFNSYKEIEELSKLYKVLAIAVMTTGNDGSKISINDKVNEIESDISYSKEVVERFNNLSYDVSVWSLDLKFQIKG